MASAIMVDTLATGVAGGGDDEHPVYAIAL
jgi:hypothetical protein